MKKKITAVICGLVAAAVIVTGSIISFGKMSEKESIGASAALTIALNDTDVSREDAKNIQNEFKKEKGRYIFDIEFDAEGYEYDYDIDAKTGEILEKSIEPITEDVSATPTGLPGGVSEQTTKNEKATPAYIELDKAKKIALDYAGLTQDSSVKFTKAKLDSDSTDCYKIEFVDSEGTEYEFEINAKTSKVLDFEKETKATEKDKTKKGNKNANANRGDNDDEDDHDDHDDDEGNDNDNDDEDNEDDEDD